MESMIASATKNQLRDFEISEELDDESLVKRVKIEAIDFDWIFNGDNCKKMINILADNADSNVLVQKSVRVFINLIWTEFQPKIIRRIFVPYIIYLLAFMQLSSNIAGDILDEVDEHYEEIRDGTYTHSASFRSHQLFCYLLTVICYAFALYFFKAEYGSFIKIGYKNYFTDPWNVLDTCSISLNITFIALLVLNITIESNEYIPKYNIRTLGAVASFFMWLKVFYWMRLFPDTAHYVTLITSTVSDVKIFFIMIMIILAAFANFFYIINFNSSANSSNDFESDFTYVPSNLGMPIFDAIMTMYLLALGEFNLDGFTQGPNVIIAWVFFLMATFIVLIVFMNMLITIVGETFGRVESLKDELSLSEQLKLI